MQMTCLRSGAACRNRCGEVSCPEYTPDFVKLAESYGAKGIRVSKRKRNRTGISQMNSKNTGHH